VLAGIGLGAKASAPNAGKLFIDFILSKKGQEIIREMRRRKACQTCVVCVSWDLKDECWAREHICASFASLTPSPYCTKKIDLGNSPARLDPVSPFVKVGDAVDSNATVGLIEVMKVFNAVARSTSARAISPSGSKRLQGKLLSLNGQLKFKLTPEHPVDRAWTPSIKHSRNQRSPTSRGEYEP
jgi:hypothetical protein